MRVIKIMKIMIKKNNKRREKIGKMKVSRVEKHNEKKIIIEFSSR